MLQTLALRVFRPTAALAFTALAVVAQGNPANSCTLLGGNGSQETVQAVVVASNGDLIIAGKTDSTDLPGTAGSFDDTYNGLGDAFVARLSPDGSQLLAATYLGGIFPDEAVFVHEAQNGEIWVGGTTLSTNFPTTANAFAAHTGNARQDAFVASFDANLSVMQYGTAFGSDGRDWGEAFAVDDQNQLVYLSGRSNLRVTPLPITPTAFQGPPALGTAFYLAVLDVSSSTGTVLSYGTYIHGTGDELEVGDVTLEGNGIVTISGLTDSTDFPITPGAVQLAVVGVQKSGVVTRIDTQASGAAGLLYGTYIGGSASETGIRHATDPGGVVHVVLESTSSDFPLTPNALIATSGSNSNADAYYAQVDPAQTGSAGLVYGSWLVTAGWEHDIDIAYAAGKVAVFMQTTVFGHLVTPGAFMPSAFSGGHGYLIELDVSSGPDPVVSYASRYAGCPVPGSGLRPGALAYDGSEAVLAGAASHAPVTVGAFQSQAASNLDAFVGRLELLPWSTTTTFGASCAGSAGTPQLAVIAEARLCRDLIVEASGLPPASVGVFLAGLDNTQYQGTPLPVSLAALGAPGCDVLVAPEATFAAVAGAAGDTDTTLAIPFRPDLVGTELYFQFASLDLTANTLGLVTTNAISAEIRW